MSRSLTALAVLIALAAPLLDAHAQPPPALGYRVSLPPVERPDLVAEITGWVSAPVPNGGQLAIPTPAMMSIRLIVKNLGPRPMNALTRTTMTITWNGIRLVTDSRVETPLLAVGQSVHRYYQAPCRPGTNTISAVATVDAGAHLREANETNNETRYTATVTVGR